MPATIQLWVELAKPDKIEIVWWEPLDKRHTYFKVKTDKAFWLVKQDGPEIQCWQTNKGEN